MATPTIDGFKADAARLGATGRIDIAPVGTPLPTDMSNLDMAVFKNLGYISSDGVTEGRDEDNEEFVPWQELTAIRSEITKSVVTLEFALWESTIKTAGFYYGFEADDLAKAADGSIIFDEKGKPQIKRHLMVLTVVDGNYARRLILPNAQITERNEVTYKSDEMAELGVTCTAYPYGDEGLSARRIWAEGWDATGVTGTVTTAAPTQG